MNLIFFLDFGGSKNIRFINMLIENIGMMRLEM